MFKPSNKHPKRPSELLVWVYREENLLVCGNDEDELIKLFNGEIAYYEAQEANKPDVINRFYISLNQKALVFDHYYMDKLEKWYGMADYKDIKVSRKHYNEYNLEELRDVISDYVVINKHRIMAEISKLELENKVHHWDEELMMAYEKKLFDGKWNKMPPLEICNTINNDYPLSHIITEPYITECVIMFREYVKLLDMD